MTIILRYFTLLRKVQYDNKAVIMTSKPRFWLVFVILSIAKNLYFDFY